MLSRIIEWSARNVFVVLLATFFVVAWGVYSVIKTPVDAIPDPRTSRSSSIPSTPARRRRWSRTR